MGRPVKWKIDFDTSQMTSQEIADKLNATIDEVRHFLNYRKLPYKTRSTTMKIKPQLETKFFDWELFKSDIMFQ